MGVETAGDRAYDALRREIVELELPPGSVLGEVEHAARLGVSRTPLRSALARLAGEGLVHRQAGRGLVVAEIDLARIEELYELREALETHAARLAARRRDPAVFAELEHEFATAAELIEHDDPARHRYYDLVSRFDDAVDAAVGNQTLVQSLDGIRTHLARARRLARNRPERLADAAREHRVIARAIEDGDADLAAHATHVHLSNALRNLREQWAVERTPQPVPAVPTPASRGAE